MAELLLDVSSVTKASVCARGDAHDNSGAAGIAAARALTRLRPLTLLSASCNHAGECCHSSACRRLAFQFRQPLWMHNHAVLHKITKSKYDFACALVIPRLKALAAANNGLPVSA
ncbi:hypothetical protein ACLK19_20390 [Escherichia coli]